MIKKVKSVFSRTLMVLFLAVFSTAGAWGQYYSELYRNPRTGGSTGDNLFDGVTQTKWCVNPILGVAYIEFKAGSGIIPKGYVLTTCNDTEENPGRNPKNWVLKGKLHDEDEEWTVLSTVTNDWKMEDEEPYYFYFPNTEVYQYFRLEVTAVQEGDILQLSEFQFLLSNNVNTHSLSCATVQSPFAYAYTGQPIDLSTTLMDVNCNVIPEDAYTVVIRDEHSHQVSEVTNLGDYQMSFTHKTDGGYDGSVLFRFSVTLWGEEGGYCGNLDENDGKNVYYEVKTVDGKGTLFIRKNPFVDPDSDIRIGDYEYDEYEGECNFAPWIIKYPRYHDEGDEFDYYELSCDFENVVIEEGVTFIGDFAFSYCPDLTSVIIPNSVESIGGNAFMGCTGLTSVFIPAGVRFLFGYAFDGCENLTSVILPARMGSIDYGVFHGCRNLSAVYCFLDPEVLGTTLFDSFTDCSPQIHVFNVDDWSAYTNVNGTFVGDLPTTITLAAKPANGLYWTTLHTGPTGYRIDADEQACAYTASYNGSGLTLHKLGKVIPAGTAVIIVAEGDAVSLTVDNTSAVEHADALTANILHGMYEPVSLNLVKAMYRADNIYVMGKTSASGFGFHRYTGANVPAGKAFLALGGTAAQAPSFSLVIDDDDEVTSLQRTPLATGQTSDSWYTLNGQRLSAQPTAKGIYIHNGRKEVIR